MTETSIKPGWFSRYAGWILGTVGSLLLVAMLGFGFYMLNQADLQHDSRISSISKIELKANFKYADVKQIEAYLQPLLNQEFIELDLALVEEKLSSHPWVRNTVLRKKWPDTLVVKVEEQVPVAILSSGGYLNSRAEVFDKAQTIKLNTLPRITAADKDYVEVLGKYAKLRKVLAGQEKISSLQRDTIGAYSLKLTSGTYLILGRRNLDKKINSLSEVFTYLRQNNIKKVRRLDFRYRNAVAMTL